MIVDHLVNGDRYRGVHAGFEAGFQFLRQPGLAALADGEYEIDGQSVYAIIARGMGRDRSQSLLEFHRKYIDIQFVIAGPDSIGWRPTDSCQRISTAYDPQRDVGFFYDRPETWLTVPPNFFAVFFPEDAHAPFAMERVTMHKVVIKVALSS